MALILTDIGVGAAPGDGTGDTARVGGLAINANNALIETAVDEIGFIADANTRITPKTAITLNQATGNEVALTLTYTVNKAAGNDTGFVIDQIDQVSPGVSLLQAWRKGGVNQATLNNAGAFDVGQVASNSVMYVQNAARTANNLELGGSAIALQQSSAIQWSASAEATAAKDVGLKRSAAGILGITNGSTGGGTIEFTEVTAPGIGAVNTARLYAEDNGAGKTKLMVQFNTGAAIQIAIEV